MDQRILEALLSDEMLKTAEDAEAAGRIASRAYVEEWRRLEGLFKGAQDMGGEEDENEDEDEGGEAGGPVKPEDLA